METRQELGTAGQCHVRMEIWKQKYVKKHKNEDDDENEDLSFLIDNKKIYVGDASSLNVYKNKNEMKNRAIKDGIKQFLNDNQINIDIGSGTLKNEINKLNEYIYYKILSIRFSYFYDYVNIKRVSKNGKYFNEVRKKPVGKQKKGKLISKTRWRNKRYEEETEETYFEDY